MTEEKTVTISFSRIFYTQYYKRSNKAIKYIKTKLKKMAKVDKVIITNGLNAEIWKRGRSLNIRRIKIKVTVDKENNTATADILEQKKENLEQKKENSRQPVDASVSAQG